MGKTAGSQITPDIEREILDAYSEKDSSGNERRFQWAGKVLNTPDFVRALKKEYSDLFGDVPDRSLHAYISKLCRNEFGSLYTKHAEHESEFLDQPESFHVEIPEGVTEVEVITRDPKTRVLIAIAIGAKEE